VQHLFVGVDEVDKALDAAGTGKVIGLAAALVDQANAHAVVQEGQLAQTLGQDLVMEVVVLREDVGVGQEVHFGAALVGGTRDAHGRDFDAVDGVEQTVLHKTLGKVDLVHFAFAAHREAQPLAQGVHARHAHAVQTARDLVAVLVELAACVQLGQGDFGGRALGLVLVVHLHARGDAAAVVGHADGVIAVDGDDDVVAVARQRFVDRVVDDLEHEVVQARAVRGVADVHAGAFAHRFQAFQNLDGAFAVAFGCARLVGVDLGLCGGESVFAGVDFVGHVQFSLSLEWPKPATGRGFR
jgi:hypothetical protein